MTAIAIEDKRTPGAAGQDPMSPSLCEQMLGLVRELVDHASETADDLSRSLGKQNEGLSQNLAALRKSRDKNQILQLLATIVQQADAIHHSVDHSTRELHAVKESLASVQEELLQTRQMLNEDALTGALNRRGLDQTMVREIARAEREQCALSVAMLDLDHFKKINDTYGHEMGDRMLVHFTGLVRRVMRKSDVLVRYGGEEFSLLMPGTDTRGAYFVVGRLQQLMSQSPLRLDGKCINTTFSAGVALLAQGEPGENLLRRADAALYTAKSSGRNNIKVAPGVLVTPATPASKRPETATQQIGAAK